MGQKREKWSAGLPYIDNAWLVLLTVVINMAVVFIFFFGRRIILQDILIDACICGITTSFIDVPLVLCRIRRLRARGRLPREVPVCVPMMKLPRRPLPLSLLFALLFGVITPLCNLIMIRFYEVTAFPLFRFAVWRAIYTCFLSIKIVEFAIYRYVQPDCRGDTEEEQHGSETVKDPIPRISTFRHWFNTVTDDFGFNMAFGLLLGGTIVRDHNVVIPPASRDGIALSAFITGLILTARMVYPIARKMKEGRESGALPLAPRRNGWMTWLPSSPALFSLALLLPITISALVVFWSVFSFFDFDVLNFFQFFVIRVLFVTFLSRLVVKLALTRFTQPMIGPGEETWSQQR